MRLLFKVILGLTCLFSPTLLLADNSNVEKVASEIYGEIMSPFCPGRLLRDCPSGKATELKEEILRDLISGQTKTEVIENLSGKFGSSVLATPPTTGFSALVWIIPGLFVLLGGLVILIFVRRSLGSKDSSPITDLNQGLPSETDSEVEDLLR